jgi:peptide-methionine (S)-S-oxide reductase
VLPATAAQNDSDTMEVRHMFGLTGNRGAMVTPESALPGRPEPIVEPGLHHVSGRPLAGPYPAGTETAILGMGCFWGAERHFWQLPGVYVTAVGYAGGFTPNPTYREVCTGKTGHSEVVLVAFDPAVISYEALLASFWEAHDPTQGMRQGNDTGTQYRSLIGTTSAAQAATAPISREAFQARLAGAGYGQITTEIAASPQFYFAEEYHQQYLDKNPNGYCGLEGTGVSCPIGLLSAD